MARSGRKGGIPPSKRKDVPLVKEIGALYYVFILKKLQLHALHIICLHAFPGMLATTRHLARYYRSYFLDWNGFRTGESSISEWFSDVILHVDSLFWCIWFARLYHSVLSRLLLLHIQRGGLNVLQRLGVGLERGLDPFGQKLVDLLGSSSDKGRRVEERVELGPDGLKVAILLDPLDQVVLASLLFDDGSSLVGQDPDLFVTILTIPTVLDNGHDDVLGSHKGKLL
jgi:hypothetical protein